MVIKNFPFVNAREKDYAFYIDKSSIKVKLKAPPFYIISTKIKVVDENLTAYYEPETEFFYDEENLEMLNRRELPEESWRWRYSTPYSYNEVEIGEAIYYLSQGKNFTGIIYGKRLFGMKISKFSLLMKAQANTTILSLIHFMKDWMVSSLDEMAEETYCGIS